MDDMNGTPQQWKKKLEKYINDHIKNAKSKYFHPSDLDIYDLDHINDPDSEFYVDGFEDFICDNKNTLDVNGENYIAIYQDVLYDYMDFDHAFAYDIYS